MGNMINAGTIDRALRLLVGIVLLFVAFIFLSGVGQAIGLVLGVVMLLTGTVGVCPLYSIFGINTCPARPTERR